MTKERETKGRYTGNRISKLEKEDQVKEMQN